LLGASGFASLDDNLMRGDFPSQRAENARWGHPDFPPRGFSWVNPTPIWDTLG